MKKIFKKLLCFMLSIMLVLGSGIAAFAETEEVTPVVFINDINANPLYNTDDGTVVFDFADYEMDILFTSGFSSEITELFSAEVIEEITSGEIPMLDLIMMLADYFGFGGDINEIINYAINLITSIMSKINLDDFDVESIISGIDFEQYAQDIKNNFQTKLDNIKSLAMNKDGTPANENIGPLVFDYCLDDIYNEDYEIGYKIAGDVGEYICETIGYENVFVFTYDWRLDPIENAAKLDEFIENVKDTTGADKVTIYSEGYGSVIATTYLAENEDAADSIKNFVTVSSEFLGTSLVGDFFKGDIVNEFTNLTNYTSAYLRYTNDISDNPLTAFTTWLINYILNKEWEVQAFCLEIEKVLSDVEFFIDLLGVTDEIAKMPGIWALVPVEDYDDAVANIFGDNADDPILTTLDTFKDYQYDFEYILADAKDAGINISVVSAWDLQILPIGENNSVQSDGIVDTAYSSFGATCIDLNEVSKAKKATQAYDDGHDHMSADYDMLTPWYSMAGACYYIDASTCALPENTWFIKNMKHGSFEFDSNSMKFLMWLITAEEERTVWQDAAYKQFMYYNRFIQPGILSSDGIVATENIPGAYLLGDINLDGLVTALDSSIAFRYIDGDADIEFGSMSFLNGDVFADSVINEADANKILLMSSGLMQYMQSGIKLEYNKEQGSLDASDYETEIRAIYNPVTNRVEMQMVLLDAEDADSGNFVLNFDTAMFTYYDSDPAVISNGNIVAGAPEDTTGILTCSFSTSGGVLDNDCDEDGNLVLATFYLDVAREIAPTSVSAGAAYFYEDDTDVFVEPVTFEMDEDFFFMLGDADNNRYLSAADARIILRIAAQLEEADRDEFMFARCDVDADGIITAKDARLVLRASAKLITSFVEA